MWIDIIKSLFDIVSKKKEIDDARRLRISEIFMDISTLINDTALELQNDTYPAGKCFAMKTLSDELMSLIKPDMKEDKWNHLNNMLQQASSIEREYADRNNPDTIKTLQKTSGEFHAYSVIFKL